MSGVPRDWTAKQGHILTGAGKLRDCYVAGRDYADPVDLPHFHKTAGTTHEAFAQWRREGRVYEAFVGTWYRPIFAGGWAEDTDALTQVVNIQTPSLFIDMRVPRDRPDFLGHTSHDTLSIDQLRILAR